MIIVTPVRTYMMDRGCYNQSCNVQAGYLNSIVIVNEMAGLTTLVSVAKAEIEKVAPQRLVAHGHRG